MSTRKLGVYASKEEFLENEVRTLSHHIVSMIDTMKTMSMNRQHLLEEMERMKQELKAAVEAEREACAELCERMARRTEDIRRAALEMAAENIRARGQDPMPLFDDWNKDWTK